MIPFVRKKVGYPLQRFIGNSRSVGIVLLGCTALSLLLSNTGFWQEGYRGFWTEGFDGTGNHHGIGGGLSLPNSPLLLINDGLMSIFFFLAGMEIKRELLTGELASLKKSALPVFAAMGGMLAPAILFSLFNKGTVYMDGWAIPTATDIAFTLGVASLLGQRIPVGLKIFLTALAIIDDLGAIVVIALFYGGQLHPWYLLGAVVLLLVLGILLKQKIRFGWLQWIIGLLLWYCMYHSGIHATVAGVLFALLVPAKELSRLELSFHHPVNFLIMPVFALANTAMLLPAAGWHTLGSTLSWGILAGLCIGKPLGICTVSYFFARKKIVTFPAGVNTYKMTGAGILAGIGFTMSIFISTLAFADTSQQDAAKLSVLLASLVAMVAGYLWLRFEPKKTTFQQPE